MLSDGESLEKIQEDCYTFTSSFEKISSLQVGSCESHPHQPQEAELRLS